MEGFKSYGWYLTLVQFAFYSIFGLIELQLIQDKRRRYVFCFYFFNRSLIVVKFFVLFFGNMEYLIHEIYAFAVKTYQIPNNFYQYNQLKKILNIVQLYTEESGLSFSVMLSEKCGLGSNYDKYILKQSIQMYIRVFINLTEMSVITKRFTVLRKIKVVK